MKWAHNINISILFDCPPNKSHCSNKHRALLRCLPLPGFELLTLQLTIYYRHLSQVTDKHCDGCMILLCQKSFISLLQATISSGLMSCAYSLSSDFLSPSCILQMETTVSLILQRSHFTRNKSVLLFTDFVIYALCGFFPVYVLVFMCALVSPCIEGVDTDELTSICICACGGVQAEQKTASCPWCCFHILSLLWMQYPAI